MKIRKEIAQFGLAFGLSLISATVGAHTLTGSIPASKTATVKWKTTCYAPATQMVFRVKQASTQKFSVSLTVTSGDKSQTVSTQGVSKIWSPFGSVQGGASDYLLTLSKVGTNPSKAVTYTLEEHCHTAEGQETGQSKPVRTR